MLHITLCDDEPSQLEFLESCIRQWALASSIEICTKAHKSAGEFLFAWEDKKDTDILLLDIEMPGINGIEAARLLRAKEDDLQIIFVTGIREYVFEGYDVDAVSYLLKPVSRQQVFECLDKAVRRLRYTEPVIAVESAGEVAKVRYKDICYLESSAHDTLIHIYHADMAGRDEIIRSKTGLGRLETELAKNSGLFFKIHRSYTINLNHVKKITHKEVVMDSGASLIIPRGKWEELNRAYLTLLRGKQEIN